MKRKSTKVHQDSPAPPPIVTDKVKEIWRAIFTMAREDFGATKREATIIADLTIEEFYRNFAVFARSTRRRRYDEYLGEFRALDIDRQRS